MLNKQTQGTLRNASSLRPTKSNQSFNEYGPHNSYILLDVPSETLTGITSYLDPPSLLSLNRVNKYLHEHIKNDNTWHRAFACQILGIGPEHDIQDSTKCLMLRHSEISWKNEFIIRYNLKRRWERSRNTTITHIPVHSSISSIHIMPGHSLLASSIEYGVVSRSFPLTGKIIPGYLDASGTRTGLGIGNPNTEFTPNVSVCALASDGGTAKVLWGYRSGEVAVVVANRTMDTARRSAANLFRCAVDEEHDGAVLAAVWDNGPGTTFVTGGADGRLKVWDAKQQVRCIWTSERNTVSLVVPDACVKVALAMRHGYIVGVLRSGKIVLYFGFNEPLDDITVASIRELQIPCPAFSYGDMNEGTAHDVTGLHVDVNPSFATILVVYRSDPHFYRLRVERDTNSIDITRFGNTSFGPIASVAPFFSATSSFVLTGDHMGSVSIYDWNAPVSSDAPVQPVRSFEAHEDGSAVTALAWNGLTLITGSVHGTIRVWDALTFEYLRSFASPMPRTWRRRAPAQQENGAVTQILVGPEKEVIMASVGDRVLAWKAGPVPKGNLGGVRGRNSSGVVGKKKKDPNAKYLQQLEMHQTISESKVMFDLESSRIKRVNAREKEHKQRLQSMGLDETEMLEYVLMVSRDEAMQYVNMEDGIFEGDFDDDTPTTNSANHKIKASTSSVASQSEPSISNDHRVSPTSNESTPISLPFGADPTEVGSDTSRLQTPSPPFHPPLNEMQFPPMSPSPSPNHDNAPAQDSLVRRASTSSSQSCSTDGGPSSSVSASPRSTRSAWNTPLARPAVNNSGASPSRVATSPSALHRGSQSVGLGLGLGAQAHDMDEDLKFAIELSLAEARSRGENV